MKKHLILAAVSALTFAACGDDDDDEEGRVARVYRATLRPLNANVAGTPSGTVQLTVSGLDLFGANVEATGLDDIGHAMHIHAGSVCPPASADTNNDGFIDVVEGVPSYGAILLPLDDALGDPMMNNFPQGSAVVYSQSTDLSMLLSALRVEDSNTQDAVTTLGPNGELTPETRTVVVHGVSDAVPASVQTIAGLPASATLPVLCGELELVPE